MTPSRNTAAITRLAAEKSEQARDRVRAAIAVLEQQGLPITFHTVARQARVSKTFLYNARHADLAADIRRLRERPPPHLAQTLPRRGKSDTAKDAQIARLQERVRHLEQEMRELRRVNEGLYGKLAERKG